MTFETSLLLCLLCLVIIAIGFILTVNDNLKKPIIRMPRIGCIVLFAGIDAFMVALIIAVVCLFKSL